MSLLDLIEELILPGETYILQSKVESLDSPEGDAFGSTTKDWSDIKTLTGIIQRPERMPGITQQMPQDPQSKRGGEEVADYLGFFEPDFEISADELGEYRVKHTYPSATPFIRFFRFKSIDRNLRFDNEISHYEIVFELTKP
jgi:hypothetical protein